jgi:hypothetical protein
LRLFATLILLVLYLMTTLALFRLLRRGAAKVFLRRRELLRLRLGLALDIFINWPLAFRLRPLRLFRRRLRAFAIVVLLFRFGLLPIKARCGLCRFRFTVFFLFVFVNAPITLLETFEAMSPARRSVRALLRRALRRRPEDDFLRFFALRLYRWIDFASGLPGQECNHPLPVCHVQPWYGIHALEWNSSVLLSD